MGETDFHIDVLLYLRGVLEIYLREKRDLYVAGNMFLYYEEGNPASVVCPDIFVVRGVEKRKRRTFKLWEEKHAPCLVVEITSSSSRIEDLGTKRAIYEMLAVDEYFVFDPLKEYLKPQLQGFRLHRGQYRKLEPSLDGALYSEQLGLKLRPRGYTLQLVDPRTGDSLPSFEEAYERMAEAGRRAEREAQRAEHEAQRAEHEAQRAERAERELKRLRERLATKGKRRG